MLGQIAHGSTVTVCSVRRRFEHMAAVQDEVTATLRKSGLDQNKIDEKVIQESQDAADIYHKCDIEATLNGLVRQGVLTRRDGGWFRPPDMPGWSVG